MRLLHRLHEPMPPLVDATQASTPISDNPATPPFYYCFLKQFLWINACFNTCNLWGCVLESVVQAEWVNSCFLWLISVCIHRITNHAVPLPYSHPEWVAAEGEPGPSLLDPEEAEVRSVPAVRCLWAQCQAGKNPAAFLCWQCVNMPCVHVVPLWGSCCSLSCI